MYTKTTSCGPPSPIPSLIPFSPSFSERNAGHWRINGYPATILIWTVDEWERLDVRPSDAQYYPCGIWCALRVE